LWRFSCGQVQSDGIQYVFAQKGKEDIFADLLGYDWNNVMGRPFDIDSKAPRQAFKAIYVDFCTDATINCIGFNATWQIVTQVQKVDGKCCFLLLQSQNILISTTRR
jgi:hypothetical protein